MAKEVRRLRCEVLDRVQVLETSPPQWEFAGFTGFDIRTGVFYEVRAKRQ
jgi:hypothetical protein